MNANLLAVVLTAVVCVALALYVWLVQKIERVENERNAALAEFCWQRAHFFRLLTLTLHGAEKYRRDREGWQNEKAKFQAELKAKSDEAIDLRARLHAVEEAYRGLQVTCAEETKQVGALQKTKANLEEEIRRLKVTQHQPSDTQSGRSSEPLKRNGSHFLNLVVALIVIVVLSLVSNAPLKYTVTVGVGLIGISTQILGQLR